MTGNKVNKYIAATATVLAIATGTTASAQEQKTHSQEALQKERMEFLIKWMELTPTEQQKFQKIHEAFHTRIRELHKQKDELIEKIQSASKQISDHDAEQLLQQLDKLHQEITTARKNLIQQLKQELGPRKALLYITGQQAFKKQHKAEVE